MLAIDADDLKNESFERNKKVKEMNDEDKLITTVSVTTTR